MYRTGPRGDVLRLRTRRLFWAGCAADVERAMDLRDLAFRGGRGRDLDAFDALSAHLLVEDGGALIACCRVRLIHSREEFRHCYTGQMHDLSRWPDTACPALELGRVALRPGLRDPDVLRLLWAGLTALVDESRAKLLFGCASFPGTDPEAVSEGLAYLADHHLAPAQWQQGPSGGEGFDLVGGHTDRFTALRQIPPLLRGYLSLGGWVGRRAVIDRDLGTIHVLTGVEPALIPPARARSLRALIAPPTVAAGPYVSKTLR